MDEIDIPFDVFYHIIPYLEPADCMSFVLSGVSPGFSSFFREAKKWDLKRSYTMEPSRCLQFFSNFVYANSVTVIDFSHLYWFPVDILHASLAELCNLEELHIVDTDLSLAKIPTVFFKCLSITRLSVSIEEQNWSSFVENVGDSDTYQCLWKSLEEGLLKLKSLRLHWGVDEFSSSEMWYLVFQILSCCSNCEEIHLEVSNPCFIQDRLPLISDCPWEEEETSQELEESWTILLSKLQWMEFLKKFIYIVKGCPFTDLCFEGFSKWLFQQLNPKNLQQVWLPSTVQAVTYHPDNKISHFCLGNNYEMDLNLERMNEITHLAGIKFSSVLHQLNNLKFVQGTCSNDDELEELCQSHPKLEHLHFHSDYQGPVSRGLWKLHYLKSLVYASDNPNPRILIKLIEACANLEELHIGALHVGTQNISTNQDPFLRAYQKIGSLKRLKILTLNGIEFKNGEFLNHESLSAGSVTIIWKRRDFYTTLFPLTSEHFQQMWLLPRDLNEVFLGCPNLKCLHICSHFDDEHMRFHRDLCLYLPLARNLRDFRFQRKKISENTLFQLLMSVSACRYLERLVIIQEDVETDDLYLKDELSVELWYLISALKNLVALIIVFPMHQYLIGRIYERLHNWFAVSRPLLWHSISDTLTILYSPSASLAPRIHIDEIANPHSYFHAPPDVFL